MEKKISLIVGEEDQNTRVDTFINKHNKEISRTRIKNLILDKNLKINNQIVEDPSKKLLLNDNVFIQVPEPKKTSLKPFKYNLNIIYEDDDLMVINKPAGIVMHPGAGNYDNTIVNALISYDKKLSTSIGDELRPGIVHRIDKNTSGLVVIAKNNPTHENLSNQFNKHTILRSYQLLIWGKLRPGVGRIETFITRSSKNRQMISTSPSHPGTVMWRFPGRRASSEPRTTISGTAAHSWVRRESRRERNPSACSRRSCSRNSSAAAKATTPAVSRVPDLPRC